MKKTAITLLTLALATSFASSAFAANAVRISQVYGGGGGADRLADVQAGLRRATIRAGAAVEHRGWTLEYGSATGNWGSSAGNIFTLPGRRRRSRRLQATSRRARHRRRDGGDPLPVAPDFSARHEHVRNDGQGGAVRRRPTRIVACGAERRQAGRQGRLRNGRTARKSTTSATLGRPTAPFATAPVRMTTGQQRRRLHGRRRPAPHNRSRARQPGVPRHPGPEELVGPDQEDLSLVSGFTRRPRPSGRGRPWFGSIRAISAGCRRRRHRRRLNHPATLPTRRHRTVRGRSTQPRNRWPVF